MSSVIFRARQTSASSQRKLKMEVGIRHAAELDMVAGGNAWTLVKVWAGAIASAIGLGPLGGAAAVTTVMGIEAAHNNPYTPNCSGTTGGCDSGTMQD
jgi:hypothetical protein